MMLFAASPAPAAICRRRSLTNDELARARRHERRVDPRRAPASAQRHIAADDADVERPRAAGVPQRARGRRHHAGGHRPDHRRDLDARHDLPVSTACILQAKLGMNGGAGVRRAGGVLGFVYALATADQFIRTGQCKQARWWSAPRSFRASSTGTTAAPACCSATAPARSCSWRQRQPGILRQRPARRRQPRRILSRAGQRVPAARSSARRSCRWTARRCSSSRCKVLDEVGARGAGRGRHAASPTSTG